MINITDKKRCMGCHACLNICPTKCISMVPDGEGFLYPKADVKKCVDCHKCEQVCPIVHPVNQSENKPFGFGIYAKETQIQERGSSGGVFYLIASQIIADGGVVAGAAFTDRDEVSHIFVSSVEELDKICKSKYVQSSIGDAYERTKDYLQGGITVLFSGTPCQIGGLIRYLGRPYDNLFLVDIVCHGVPSPALFKKYIGYQEEKNHSKISAVTFRDKTYGWSRHSIRIDFVDGKQHVKPSLDDIYMKAYLKNLTIRPACFDCQFKSISRASDITLADFWGVQKIAPDIKSDRGTSLIMIHTERGETLFNCIKNSVNYKAIDIQEATEYNCSMIKRPKEPQNREEFIICVFENGFEKADKIFLTDGFITKAKRKVGSFLRSLQK